MDKRAKWDDAGLLPGTAQKAREMGRGRPGGEGRGWDRGLMRRQARSFVKMHGGGLDRTHEVNIFEKVVCTIGVLRRTSHDRGESTTGIRN